MARILLQAYIGNCQPHSIEEVTKPCIASCTPIHELQPRAYKSPAGFT